MNKSMLFKITYLGPTNTKGSRVKISTQDARHYNNEKPHTKVIHWDHSKGSSTLDQSIPFLESNGFKVTSVFETKDHCFIGTEWDWNKLVKTFKVKE